jgi:hypothetical protein
LRAHTVKKQALLFFKKKAEPVLREAKNHYFQRQLTDRSSAGIVEPTEDQKFFASFFQKRRPYFPPLDLLF